MADRTIEGQPSALPTMLKAALPVLPGVNLIPGIAKKGDSLPDLTLHRKDIAVDPGHVAAYAGVCGFAPSQTLPFTYPHMLAFPLHMAIMTDGSFPFPAIGTVHLGNRITQHRPISPAVVGRCEVMVFSRCTIPIAGKGNDESVSIAMCSGNASMCR